MCKNSSISRFQTYAINGELYASPDTRDELLTTNPYHKGFDPAVQAARVKTARAIDLSGAVDRAATERKSNLEWFRSNVQQLVEDFQFAPHLYICSWLSDVAWAPARPLPVHSFDRGPFMSYVARPASRCSQYFHCHPCRKEVGSERAKTSCPDRRGTVPDEQGRGARQLMLRTMVHGSIGI